ncbi:hypothetical protein KAF25_002944 [Fusarium avenaceum]|uniref:Uncharacterized protein n=1 Tax=Fusarium avenaceum TaxID=40199 RepID=A0A9P7H1Y1_9HYPO|nr:hypothetical protein KAF25_002944 [Fusarium avenaceum]
MLLLLLFTGCATADGGDDFSNNMFSDLAPLLALFGERVAMQFMSQSMGWADHFILAMAPVGIITIIVSAIRVGGPSWLKAIIGRARENLAVAEAELMSSTSKEVCELWNGQEVVRCMGSAPVIEFICLLPKDQKSYAKMEIETIDLKEALRRGDLTTFDKSFRQNFIRTLHPNSKGQDPEPGLPSSDPPKPNIVIVRNTNAEAPNISLNSHNQFNRGELRVVAIIATILQFGVLIFCGLATYYPSLKFQKEDTAIQSYAFPCTATGTLTLVVGLLICSHVVESSTTEERYKPGPGRRARMVWLQKTQTVSDQHFGSYAIFAADDRELITTSHRAMKGKDAKGASDGSHEGGNCAKTLSADSQDKKREALVKLVDQFGIKAVIGTAISLYGFIVQFIGLRGMHWSASIAQLLAVLIMMALRALVRRGLAKPPECIKLTSGFELDWFATTLGAIDNAPWMAKRAPDSNSQTGKSFRQWTISTGEIAQSNDDGPKTNQPPNPDNSGSKEHNSVSELNVEHLSSAHEVMKLRRNLGWLADWRGPASEEAISATRAIEITMDTLFGASHQDSMLSWSLCAQFGGQQNPVNFRLERQDSGKWKAYSDEIEASLSLWLYSVNQMEEKDSPSFSSKPGIEDDAWHRAKGSSLKRSLRVLGLRTDILSQNLEWWMPIEAASISEVANEEETLTGVEGHRVVGSGVRCWSEGGNASTGVNKDSRRMILVTEAHSSLKLLYAQDIFSAFMWTAAKLLAAPMPGVADIRPIDDTTGADSWQHFKLQNQQLSKMVQDIQNTGLGNASDIYLSVIPSLGLTQKLPVAEAIIRLARDHAKRYEQLGQLTEAGHIYMWLFQTIAVFEPKARLYVRATAVLVEHLRQLTLTIEFDDQDLKGLKRQKSDIQELLKTNIRQSGKSAVFRLVSNLEKMYEVQGRGWEFGLLEKERSESIVLDHESDEECELDSEDSDSEDSDSGTFSAGDKIFNRKLRSLMYIPSLGPKDLHHLALCNSGYDPTGLEATMKRAGSMDCRDVMDWTPLHYMAAVGFGSNSADKIDDRRMDTTACDLIGWTPLHYASLRGFEWMVLVLIGEGAGVNAQGRDGKAPLHCAAMAGHLDTVRLLVEAGAVIDVVDAFRTTPLQWAVRKGYQTVVEYLWPEASHKLRDYKGRTVLHLAIAAGKIEMVKILLGQTPRADTDAKDRNGQAPLHYATERSQESIVEFLVKNGADKDIQDRQGETPLHYAANRGQETMANFLVDAGASMEVRNIREETPLWLAVKNGNECITKLLINAGVDVDARDRNDRVPLHKAAQQYDEGITKMLLEAGADKEQRDCQGSTPLFYAISLGKDENIVKILLDAGAKVGIQNHRARTPLHLAAEGGHGAIARLLIDAGANKEAQDEKGSTPLNSAATYGKEDTVRVLIDAGVDKEAQGKEGFSPLHSAVLSRDEATIAVLIHAGANKEARNKEGSAPLHSAVENGQLGIVRLLIDEGADKEAQDGEGMTPLHLAVARYGDIFESQIHSFKKADGTKQDAADTLRKFDSVFKKEAAMVELLINAGSDKDAATLNGLTPRLSAGRSLNPYIRKLLDIEEELEL